MLLANLVFFAIAGTTTDAQFLAWGWRIPFLVSIVLIAVGFVIRSRVAETPVFSELRRRRARRSAPLGELLRHHRRQLVVAIGLFVANTAVGYILIAFITSYGTRTLGVSSATMLLVGMVGAVSWGVFTMIAGRWSDRVGRRRSYLVGTIALLVWPFPFFLLLDTAALPLMLLAVVGLGVGLGLTYGQQAADVRGDVPRRRALQRRVLRLRLRGGPRWRLRPAAVGLADRHHRDVLVGLGLHDRPGSAHPGRGARPAGAARGRARRLRGRSRRGRQTTPTTTRPGSATPPPAEGDPVPYYRSVGEVPPKRHTQFRTPAGGLYYEELMGEEGFSSDSSLLYHRGVPSAIVDATPWELPDQTTTENTR